ncbi:MAG TPA: hypothetical protein DEB39_05435 [Planctomycetaceae bacterium]|nr:hypothetical protein [Planctomycetaceae bacterium]
MSKEEREKWTASAAKGYAIGFQVLAASLQMVVFPLVGNWLDDKLGTAPWCMLIGLASGVYATFSQLMSISKQSFEHTDSEKTDSNKKDPEDDIR